MISIPVPSRNAARRLVPEFFADARQRGTKGFNALNYAYLQNELQKSAICIIFMLFILFISKHI